MDEPQGHAALMEAGAELYARVNDALEAGLAGERDRYLRELGALTRAHSEEAELREMLAFALFNAFATADDAGDRALRDQHVQSLWALQRAHPAHERVARACAKALFGLGLEAERADDQELAARRRADLQTILGGLSGDWIPTEVLSPSFYHWLVDGDEPDGPVIPDTVDRHEPDLSEAARNLHVEENRAVIARRQAELVHACVDRDEPERRDHFLKRLRDLRTAHPEDRYVASRLAYALINASRHASERGEGQASALAEELKALRDWLLATQEQG